MLLTVETIVLCLIFWLLCYLGTGTDEKNLKSFRSYPDAVQSMLKADPRLKDKIPPNAPGAVFVSNVMTFTVVLFFFGLPLRREAFLLNFMHILIFGEVLNGFDFFIMDLCWFRNSRRTRFRGTEDQDQLYRNPKNHFLAFLRGIPAFLITAILDGLILSWI